MPVSHKNSAEVVINMHFPSCVDAYIDGIKETADRNHKLVNLVLTLKNLGNPLEQADPNSIDGNELFFTYLAKVMEDNSLTYQGDLSKNNKDKIGELLQKKLDEKADEIISNYNLTDAVNNKIADIKKQIENHLFLIKNNKSYFAELSQQEELLDKDLKANIKTRAQNFNKTYITSNTTFGNNNELFLFILLGAYGRDTCHSNSFSQGVSFPLPIIVRSDNCSLSCGGSSSSGNEIAVILAIIAIVGIIIAGIVGSGYALKKTYNSLCNILNGNKLSRSAYRLAGTGGGLYGGFIAGTIAGAALGTIIPGMGTAVGAIVGGIFGAGMGAGLGAFLMKHSARLFSSLYYGDTNPEKWQLNVVQKENIKQQNIPEEQIQKAMKIIRDRKSKLNPSEFNPDDPAHKQKAYYNDLLADIKNGKKRRLYSCAFFHEGPALSKLSSAENSSSRPSHCLSHS